VPKQDGFDDEQNLYGRKVAVWPWNCLFSLMNMIFMGMNRMVLMMNRIFMAAKLLFGPGTASFR